MGDMALRAYYGPAKVEPGMHTDRPALTPNQYESIDKLARKRASAEINVGVRNPKRIRYHDLVAHHRTIVTEQVYAAMERLDV